MIKSEARSTTVQSPTMDNMESTTKNWLKLVVEYAHGIHNDSSEINKPHLRSSVVHIYTFVIFIYIVLSLFGILLNVIEIFIITRNRLYRDATYTYLLNLCIADIVKCAIVIPVSLNNLLMQNWVFGGFLCYFLPMLQDVPAHVTVLTMLMITLDRYNFLKNPSRSRLPGLIFSTGAWLTSICFVLPYPIYTTYIDLGAHINTVHSKGVGLCIFNIEKDLKEYSKTIFIVLFGGRRDSNDYLDSEDIDPKEEEKKLHKCLAFAVIIFFLCYGALSILKIVHMTMEETYDNSRHWDILFVIFVWLAFLPTVITPISILLMIMSKEDAFRIRNCFRLNRNRSYCHRNLEDEDNMASVTCMSRPSAATVTTDFDQLQDRRRSS